MKNLARTIRLAQERDATLPNRNSISTGFHLLLTVLVGLACNSATLAWLEPSATPVSTESPQQSRLPLQTVESGLDQLASYRTDVRLKYKGVRGGQQSAGEIVQTELVDDQLRHLSQVITSSSLSFKNTEFFQTEDRVYVRQDDNLFWFERDVVPELNPPDVGILPLQKFIQLPISVSTALQLSTWNNLPVQSYRFTEADLSHPQFVFEQARGQLQINPEGNYLVQYALTATVEAAIPLSETHLIDDGEISIRYTLSQPNAVTISAPAEKDTINSTLALLPRPQDARISVVYPLLLEYTSVISPISATLFYGSRLTGLGWTQTLTSVFNEKARLAFEKGEERISVIILPDAATDIQKITLSLDH